MKSAHKGSGVFRKNRPLLWAGALSTLRALVFWFLILGGGWVGVDSAQAWKWEEAPQPLIGGPPGSCYAITADPRSPLAFHSRWKTLFSVRHGSLTAHTWNGFYFEKGTIYWDVSRPVHPESALVLDESRSQLFFITGGN